MHRPDVAQPDRGPGALRAVLLWALGAALVSVVAVWWLLPRTPDAFSAADNALQAGHGTTSGAAFPVYVGSPSPPSATPAPVPTPPPPVVSPSIHARNPPGTVPNPPGTGPNPPGTGPNTRPYYMPTAPSTPPSGPQLTRKLGAVGTAAVPALPAAAIGRDVANAARYSSAVAVEIAGNHSFAVAAVPPAGDPSAFPVLGVTALLAAVAGLGGALLARRGTGRDPFPIASTSGPVSTARTAVPVLLPPGTERIASNELRGLRRRAEQKTVLARSVAELLPSMPEALVWQAEKALAEVGVRPIVPDGEPFDAVAHHAVGVEPVRAGARENTIARTVRSGYADDETILVYPKVVVYADDTDGAP